MPNERRTPCPKATEQRSGGSPGVFRWHHAALFPKQNLVMAFHGGTQMPRSVTVDHTPEVAVFSSGRASIPMPLLSPQYKYASLTKHLDP